MPGGRPRFAAEGRAILHPGAERKFYLRADVRAVSRRHAQGMTEFDVVTVQGVPKTYGPGVVVGRLDFDVRPGEILGLADADGAGKTTVVERVQGLRRALDLFATPRARDGTRLLEQFGLGERCR